VAFAVEAAALEARLFGAQGGADRIGSSSTVGGPG
jgi:hypothetical protein